MNRVSRFFPAPTPAPPAFVPCPLLGLVPAMQVPQVLAVYRLAAERAREQLAARRPSRQPAFSCN